MTILPLTTAKSNLEQLLTPAVPFHFTDHNIGETLQLCKDMVESLYHYNGLGISANQLGLPWSIFAMRGDPEDFVLFNPRIVHMSPEQDIMEEGCLSWPGLQVKMKRAIEIRLRFSGPDNNVISTTFKNITSRVVQHEMLHLQGKMWFDGCSRLHLEPALRRALNKGYDYSNMGLLKHVKKAS
jgi:peptide deformylase